MAKRPNSTRRAKMEYSKETVDLPSGNKPKKSKNDLVRAAVGIHLKQKSYVGSDKFRKTERLQNKEQFVFQKMLETDLQGGNCFAYSNVLCITNNQQIVDQQFGRFSQFVESQSDLIRLELRRFYGPMLCHLFLELMRARELKAALDLLKKYAHLVAPVDTYDAPLPTKINGCSVPSDVTTNNNNNDISAPAHHHTSSIRFAPRDAISAEDPETEYFVKLIQTLSACSKLETAENDAEVAHFRAAKHEIHTTEAVVDALCTYLEKRGHVLILNLLYTWLHVHIVDNEVRKWTDDCLFMRPDDSADGGSGAEDDDDALNEPEDMKPSVAPPERKPKMASMSSEKPSSIKRCADEPALQLKAEPPENAATAAAGLDMGDDDDKKGGRMRNVRVCLQSLRESREQLCKTQTEIPRFIKIADKCRGLTSAHLDANECHLVAGFNNSTVQLWQLNQQTCSGRNLYSHLTNSRCSWELNNCCKAEADPIEIDIQEHARRTTNERARRKYDARKYEDNSYSEFGGIQLRGHGLGVTDVRFSAHYPLIYSVSKDTTMRCWRAENYACAGVYRGHRYPIWCVDESPVGMYIATGSKDLTARLWSLDREFPLITYAGHTQDVECLAFHPNGNYIATGSADLSVRLWCVTSGKLMRVFSDCKQPVTNIAFSPDGRLLAAGGEETKIRIFDLAAGAQLNELKEHSASVSDLAWSANGRQLASVCRDGSLRLWDVKKLTPMHNESTASASTSSGSSSTATNRLMALNSNCQRLVKVFFSRNETICCVGS